MKKILLTFLSTALLAMPAVAQKPKLGTDDVQTIVNALSKGDRAHLVQGMGVVKTYVGINAVPGASGYTMAFGDYNIPTTVWTDGPAGVRLSTVTGGNTCEATFFPTATVQAATWNTALIREMGQALGNETKEFGCDILLGPGVNIHRHPLSGRNFEYYSEDPVLSGKLGAAYITGVQQEGVGVSLKHFAANNQETNRKENDSQVSKRALREIYLRPFEIAVKEGHPWTVMSSYNKLNGTRTSERYDLLTTLLRNEWGFDGVVTSDWINNADAVSEIRAGNDMLMPGSTTDYYKLAPLFSKCPVEDEIKLSCQRILTMMLKTPAFAGYKYSSAPDLAAHAQVARRTAGEGIILLKNENNALPFGSDIRQVALFGSLAYRTIAGGTGSGAVSSTNISRLPAALVTAGYQLDEALQNAYEAHIKKEGTDNTGGGMLGQQISAAKLPGEMALTLADIQTHVANNQMAVVVIGRSATEATDRDEKEFFLRSEELALIQDACTAFHEAGKRVAVVLNVAGVVETASWKHLPDAILLPFLGGQECGNAIADVLSGAVNPSGKLPMTFPVSYRDHASATNFPIGTNIGEDVTRYEEDIWVGYRDFDAFDKAVSYPFGYGLSYTTFQYSNFSAHPLGDNIEVSITVTNTGNVPGKEVVEFYSSAPEFWLNEKPNRELKAFCKTRLLMPGENETLTAVISKDDLASFHADSDQWIVDAGNYTFTASASSRDHRLSAAVQVEYRSRSVNDILAPQQSLSLLQRPTTPPPAVVSYDVNRDGNVDADDVKAIENIILHKDNTESYDHEAADVNSDSKINVTDIINLIEFIIQNS